MIASPFWFLGTIAYLLLCLTISAKVDASLLAHEVRYWKRGVVIVVMSGLLCLFGIFVIAPAVSRLTGVL